MAKKVVIFILGMFLLSTAWMGVISSVKKQQEVAQKENMPVKFNLVQSRWERLSNFHAKGPKGLKKPAEFLFKFSGMDLNLVESKYEESLGDDFYLEVKKAYLDAGKTTVFFTLNSSSRGQYLVRAIKNETEVEAVGFELDSVLNYLRQGLEQNEWFLVDSKNRVVASDVKAYVGEPHNGGDSFEEYKFAVLGKGYTFSVLKPKGVNLALANFMGVLGIFLILSAVYVYTENGGASEMTDSEEAPLSVTPDMVAAKSKPEAVFTENEMVEDVRMVDLTNTRKEGEASLDYTDFLIDNPILGGAPKVAEQQEVVVAKEDKVQVQAQEIERVSSDDWVKLAEELSANIDRFTQNLEEGKDSEDTKVEV
ncbi:MAG: hypothetical protein ACRBBP_09235 [Bdellovibrionales bacterium]